jgi:hypothetical protein
MSGGKSRSVPIARLRFLAQPLTINYTGLITYGNEREIEREGYRSEREEKKRGRRD